MGSILASTIISRAAGMLHDISFDRWSSADLLSYLNDGQIAVCNIKPDAYVVNIAYQLSAGTKQSIPDGSSNFQDPNSNTIEAGIMLLDIVRNMGTDGLTPGNIITLVEMEQLDLARSGWHNVTASPTVVHYMFRESDPKRFYVYPKQPVSNMGWIEIVMGAVPGNIPNINTVITLDDIYFNPLLDFLLYRAYMRDDDSSADKDLALVYYQQFERALLTKEMREKADSPQINRTQYNG